jgi:hypothetical protein
MRCYYIRADGRCEGQYEGFACIGPKCRANKEPPCEYYVQGFYCSKYRRFGCEGLSRCPGLSVPVMKVKRENAKA